MKRKILTFIMSMVMVIGMVTSASAATGDKAWREWKYPSDYDKVSKDSNWKDNSWEKKVEVTFNCDGMEYACIGKIGFSDGVFSNKDYVTEVGGVSAGMKCGCRVYNADGDQVPTGWIQSAKLSGKVSINNTGTGVKFKFTVATKGY